LLPRPEPCSGIALGLPFRQAQRQQLGNNLTVPIGLIPSSHILSCTTPFSSGSDRGDGGFRDDR